MNETMEKIAGIIRKAVMQGSSSAAERAIEQVREILAAEGIR